LLVENGVGVTPGLWITWPTVKYNLPPDKLSGGSELALVSDGLIVGRAPQVDGSVRSEVPSPPRLRQMGLWRLSKRER